MRLSLNKYRGVSLTETLISVSILLFASCTSIMLITSNSAKTTLIEHRVRLANVLDDRVNEFLLSGTFDSSSDGDMSFSEEAITDTDLHRYTATDSASGISISETVFG